MLQSIIHTLSLLFYPALSYPALSHLILQYLILSYLILSLFTRSVAVVAWELFTGECPYEGLTHIEVRYTPSLSLLRHSSRCRTISLSRHLFGSGT